MTPMLSESIITEILAFVKPGRDVSLQEIVKATGFNRNTVSKYVLVLEAQKRLVHTRTIGAAKLYTAPIVLPKPSKEDEKK